MNASEEKLLHDLREKIGNIQTAIAKLQVDVAEASALVSVLQNFIAEREIDNPIEFADNECVPIENDACVEDSGSRLANMDVESDAERDESEEKTAEIPVCVLAAADGHKSSVVEDKSPGFKAVDARLLTDLRKAIGLNDRFRFRHDLFANDDRLMMETIDTLNNLQSFDEALSFLRENFDWDEDNPTVTYLLDILHRRYYV